MRQEINLYTLDFRRGEQRLSSRFIVRSVLAFIAVLMLVELITVWQLFSARDQLDSLQSEEQVLVSQLEKLRASRPATQRRQLENEVEAMRGQVQRREELKALIAGQNLGNAEGFSPYLQAMARQASDDLSLTHIRLLNGGDYLELGGWTRRPEAVPLYLDKLRSEYSFEKVKFGVLGIEQDSEYSHKLRFSLGKPEGEST